MGLENNENKKKNSLFILILCIILTVVFIILIKNICNVQPIFRTSIASAKASSNHYAVLSLTLASDYLNIKAVAILISILLVCAGIYYSFIAPSPKSVLKENDQLQTTFSSTPGVIMILTGMVTVNIVLFHTPKIEFINNNGQQKYYSINGVEDKSSGDSPIDTNNTENKKKEE